ncbi:MAG: carboxypeptidase-like regulatory domain-containing protein [Bacteroidota bacterium]|nr:carboxypeptidase-like regulatory domain-containing protein [Bacteroidota bacterium]MDX5404061.1 carboxypeptidase-like regulatory domain-containing protein [Bacteroidota bacterium]MDX5427030.1 carboxypeptidase-like regulatory domain-containing protein [Bacteroidota bacterium]MDX5446740.1 carboxypeptidase-like regulatory domain-containing protein [Bacteroidota bacterium]MDX5505007.1 carboxypeptidase-like regulatory domain-containing protein [Bacteroidota bacterium]
MRNLFTLILCLTLTIAFAQKEKVVEISGVVVTKDGEKQLIPNVHVRVQGRNQGTITNEEGFFSFAAIPNDTIIFSALGFKRAKLWVPDSLAGKSYLSLVPLARDTTVLQEVTLYPWPTPDRFKDEFLAMQVPTTDMDLAQRNLAIQALKDRAAAMGYDAREMQDYMMRMQEQNLYNEGRYYGANGGAAIIGALSNPFAWAQFFEALKRGDFKNK